MRKIPIKLCILIGLNGHTYNKIVTVFIGDHETPCLVMSGHVLSVQEHDQMLAGSMGKGMINVWSAVLLGWCSLRVFKLWLAVLVSMFFSAFNLLFSKQLIQAWPVVQQVKTCLLQYISEQSSLIKWQWLKQFLLSPLKNFSCELRASYG